MPISKHPPRRGNTPPTTLPQDLDIETAARLRTVIGRLSRRLRSTAAGREAGLTPTKVSVLLNVARTSPIRLADLAASEGLNPTLLSRVTGELVAAGLLERSSDPDDRRAAWVKVSRAGRRLTERMRSERTEAVNVALRGLSAQDRACLEKALPALEVLAEELKERRP